MLRSGAANLHQRGAPEENPELEPNFIGLIHNHNAPGSIDAVNFMTPFNGRWGKTSPPGRLPEICDLCLINK